MRKHINAALANPLISGSIIIFAGTLIANVFNFLFNVYMSRNLSVADYGIMASLVSIILLCALISEAFVPTVVHFAASHFATKDLGKVKDVFWRLKKISLSLGILVLVFFIVFNSQISDFFKIADSSLLIIVGVIVLFNFLAVISRAILQAKLSFAYISFISLGSAVLKLLLGITLVYLGFRVGGAMWAFLLAAMTTYALAFPPLRSVLSAPNKKSEITYKYMLSYGGPSAIALLSVTSFITSDIILVKHFYSSTDAGIYAGLSLLGRIIYFFSAPIAQVMFPLIVQRKARLEKYNHLFSIAFLLTAFASIGITLFYFAFPEFSIRLLLKNEEYLTVVPLLGFFGIYLTLFCLLSLTTNFFLSIKKTKASIPVFIGSLLQVVLIWFYHESFLQIITISISIVSLLLVCLLLYYLKLYGFGKRH